jgi:hypothetical protein
MKTEKQKPGAKPKPAGEKADMPVTRYLTAKQVVQLGGMVKIRMMVDQFLETELNRTK